MNCSVLQRPAVQLNSVLHIHGIEVLLQTLRGSLSAGYQYLWFLDNFYQQVISILI